MIVIYGRDILEGAMIVQEVLLRPLYILPEMQAPRHPTKVREGGHDLRPKQR